MLRPMVLINSGAYVPQELSAEFGPLPPAFLPVGMRRLYEFQVEAFRDMDADIYLTAPESMIVPEPDTAMLQKLGVKLIRSPDGLELGAALLFALAHIGFSDRPLRILHGDTLVSEVDTQVEDAFGAAEGADGYRWAKIRHNEGRVTRVTAPEFVEDAAAELRLVGYFSFGSMARFARTLALTRGDFFEALTRYASETRVGILHVDQWFDFGHVQTFFRSRRMVTTARAFNTLQISETRVRKRSTDATKLQGEANWLREAPSGLRPYTARLIDAGDDAEGFFYDTEYEYMPTLAELFVFGRLRPASWRPILASCQAFLDEAARTPVPESAATALEGLVVRKTEERLEQFARETGFDLDAPNRLNGRAAPSLRRCLGDLAAVVRTAQPRPAVMHGDFGFSNILWNIRTGRIRVIDPRGILENGEPGIHGDAHYDAAKLMHSVEGRYDLIIAGRYEAVLQGPNEFQLAFPADEDHEHLARTARSMTMGGVRLDSEAVSAATISLFLSMPPLHADRPDRQTAFIANALRLHLDMDAGLQ